MSDLSGAGETLAGIAARLEAGRTTSRDLVEACLDRIDDEGGEGRRAFLLVDHEGARQAADAADRLRRAGAAPSRFAGIPVSIKDLFDVRGQVTRAGSVVLNDMAPAAADAPAVARLRRHGFVLVGRTNMTEFAYSGLGLNPHHGTPLNGWDRAAGRIPGGSSSGAAVSVADGMADAALGTDTGGSCRIPAAFTGLVGVKPTARRVPLAGALPLSPSLDSIGPIARSVACCAALDAVLAGLEPDDLAPLALPGLRIAVPTTLVLDDCDETVGRVFEQALKRLAAAGLRIEHAAFPEFDLVAAINAKGGLTAPESYAWHRRLLSECRSGYDPRVAVRIERGGSVGAADYIDALALRAAFVGRMTDRLAGYDALLMPTVPIVAPRLSDLQSDDAFGRINLLALRNPTLVNMMDGCGVSIPIHRAGEAPVGLTVAGLAGSDRRLLAIAAAAHAIFGEPEP